SSSIRLNQAGPLPPTGGASPVHATWTRSAATRELESGLQLRHLRLHTLPSSKTNQSGLRSRRYPVAAPSAASFSTASPPPRSRYTGLMSSLRLAPPLASI